MAPSPKQGLPEYLIVLAALLLLATGAAVHYRDAIRAAFGVAPPAPIAPGAAPAPPTSRFAP